MRGNSNDGLHKRHDIIPTFPESEEFMENKTFGFSRKIGTTLYRANIHYTPQSTESFEEKLMRLIRQEALDFFGGYGIMNPPQASHQSERSQYGYQAG